MRARSPLAHRRKALVGAAALLCCALSCAQPAYAADQLANNNHIYDTADYCLTAYDVRIGLAEIRSLATEANLQAAVLSAASPTILVRPAKQGFADWQPISTWSADFSACTWQAGAQGYPVALTAPAITLASPSTIAFNVYVVDDLPVLLTITLAFANCDGLPPQTYEVGQGGGAAVSLADLDVPQREGYAFVGWYADEELSSPFLVPGEGTEEQTISASTTIYAKWEQIQKPDAGHEETPDEGMSPEPGSSPGAGESAETPYSPTHSPTAAINLPLSRENTAQPANETAAGIGKTDAQDTAHALSNSVREEEQAQSTAPSPSSPQPTGFTSAATVPPAQRKEDFMASVSVLVAEMLGIAAFGGLVASDVRVLAWYANKKKTYVRREQ